MWSLVHIGNIVNAQKMMKRWKLERQKGGSLFRASFRFFPVSYLLGGERML